MARPSIYSEELADEICERIANGESVLQISRDDKMPARSSITLWIREKPEFSDKYAKAKALQAEHYVDECLYIAETEEDVNRARLKIDTRKWYASKVLPKIYGDRTIQEQSGSVEHKHTLDKDGVKALFDEIDRRL